MGLAVLFPSDKIIQDHVEQHFHAVRAHYPNL